MRKIALLSGKRISITPIRLFFKQKKKLNVCNKSLNWAYRDLSLLLFQIKVGRETTL